MSDTTREPDRLVRENKALRRRVAALEAEAERFKTTLQSIGDAVISVDTDGNILQMNAVARQLTGWGEAEALGQPLARVFRIVNEETRAEVEGPVARVLREGVVVGLANHSLLVSKDGTEHPIADSGAPIRNEEGKTTGVVLVFRNQTEERAAQKALQESEERFRMLVENVKDCAIITLDVDGIVTSWNAAAERIKGYRADEIVGQHFSRFYQKEDVERGKPGRELSTSAAEGRFEEEAWRVRRDGSRFWANVIITPLRDNTGHLHGFGKITRDITERKRTEAALRESEERNRTTLYSIGDAVIATDEQGRVVQMNPIAERLTGWSEAEAIGQPLAQVFRIVNEETRAEVESPVARVLREGAIVGLANHTLLIAKDGTERPVADSGAPIRNEKGEISGVVLVFRSQAEARAAQETLRQAGLYNRSLIEASLDPLVTIGPEGKITDVNDATIKVTGCPREKLTGSDFSNYFTEPEKAREGYQRVFAEGQVTDYPLEVKHSDGHTTPVLYNATVYEDEDGHVVGVFAAARDITALKRAEAEVRKLNAALEQRVRDRTAELEESNKELEAFSYSVSHDLRAPLRAIDGFTRILADDYAPYLDTEGKRLCSIIHENTGKMGQLIDDLLAFSRLGRAEMSLSQIDMGTMANSVFHELTTPEGRARIDFQVGAVPPALADPTLMRQVWMNLLSNAIKFSSKRGRAFIKVSGQQDQGESVYAVQDNGAGFDMQYVGKLFGVFQRLHNIREFEGTGVGLALVQRVIRRHGGRVWAQGEPDKGATFYFALQQKGA